MQVGKADVTAVIGRARERLGAHGRRTILFLDEIHRFNKAQQDALLPVVESGLITLIGATTENPYFEINSALLVAVRAVRVPAAHAGRPDAARGARRGRPARGARRRHGRCDRGGGRRRRARGAGDARAGHRRRRARAASRSGATRWRRRRSSGRCGSTATVTSTSMSRRRSSRACAVPTRTRRSTGWR